MKKILITGVNGFIGSHLTSKYLANGYQVIGIDIQEEPSRLLKDCNQELVDFRYFKIDVHKDESKISSLIEEADTVIHLAAIVGIKNYLENPLLLFEVNVLGSANLIKLCIEHKKRFVFSSTSEIFGKNPRVPWNEDADRVLGSTEIDRWGYSTSKATIEHLLHAVGPTLDYRIVRFFNVYGPGQNPIFLVSRNIQRSIQNLPIEAFDSGNQTRCLTYIDDAIEGIYLVSNAEHPKHRIYNVGSEKENSIAEICKLIHELNPDKSVNLIDTSVNYGDSYEDLPRRVPSTYRISSEFGWIAETSAEMGVKLFYEWAKNNSWWSENSAQR
jgi:nucleoside-diphosphate-sugar epimerase